MPRKQTPKNPALPRFLIVLGLVLLIAVVLIVKGKPQASTSAGDLPEAQLENALRAGKPVLAFFHSSSCEQCIIMIKTVGQVFPEFSESVTLVDINVYDPNNQPLLQKVRLQYIPTLIFYDRQRQEQAHVGVMTADVLRQRLSALAGAE